MDLSQRIASLDLLRGFAILGILFMNIIVFTLPEPAYISPAWAGEPSFADKIGYSAQFMFANAKFYSLFCLLFGAGMVVFWQRAEIKGFDAKALVKTRLRWLLLFGILHLTLLFFGDILVTYALCGMLLLGSVSLESGKLLRRGIIFIGITALLFTLFASLALIDMPQEEQMIEIPVPADKILLLIEQATGSIGQMIYYNIKHGGALVLSLPIMFWLLGGIMLLGMALMKRGFFDKGLSNTAEALLFILGLSLSSIQLALQWQTDFTSLFALMLPLNSVAAVMIAIALASRGVKICQNNPNALMPLQYAGRMAFSLYIFQSITMTLVFRWIAPGLFATLSRFEMLAVAAIMTIVQLILATWWQKNMGQGPLEKLWRHLIYRNHQPQVAVQS